MPRKINQPVVVGMQGDAVLVVDETSLNKAGKVKAGALAAYTTMTNPVRWSDEINIDVLLRFVPFYDAKDRDLASYGYEYPKN